MRTTMDMIPIVPARGRPLGGRLIRLYVRLRRNATLLLAAAVALGVLFMVIHWR